MNANPEGRTPAPRGCCPDCAQRVRLRGLKPAGHWHGLDAQGLETGGDLYEVSCPNCLAPLVAYEEDRAYPVDAQDIEWQTGHAPGK